MLQQFGIGLYYFGLCLFVWEYDVGVKGGSINTDNRQEPTLQTAKRYTWYE